MKPRILLFSLVLFSCTFIKAHDFRVDDIYYNITDTVRKCVEVTYKGDCQGGTIRVRDDYKNSVVVIPSSVTYNGISYTVTGIGNSAFEFCENIRKMSIPNSVTSIGAGAFRLSSNLVEIDFSENISSIGSGAFGLSDWYSKQPDGLLYIGKVLYDYKGKMPENTEIIIKAGTKNIQGGAFQHQSNLIAVTLPDGLTEIGDYAFDGCTFLNSIEIPNSVTRICEKAFRDCEDLETVKMSEGIKSIGEAAFRNCDRLVNITIPGGTIDEYAFADCKRLKTVILGDKVTRLEHWAFCRCGALTSVTIGRGVTTIKDAFDGCSNLSAVHISDMAAWCGIDFYYSSGRSSNPLNNCAGNLYLNGEIVVDLVIPDGVTQINEYVFEGCSSIKSVKIPSSVKEIGWAAFRDCSNLKKAVLNCPVIENFSYSPISEIEIGDSVISIGNRAFRNLTNLTSIVIPDNVKSIGSSAFENCKALSMVKLGRGIVSVGKEAFSGCVNITEVHLCDIAPWCNIDFADYRSNPLCCSRSKLYLNGVLLTDLVIPDGVTKIKKYSFYDESFSKVTIPSSVTSITKDAFYSNLDIHISDLSAWCKIDFGNRVTPMEYKGRLYLDGKKVSERKLLKYYHRSKK